MNALLTVSGVGKSFGGVAAVRDASLEVEAGEVVGLIGPNGAGKTTMVNLITRHVPMDSGTVVLGGVALERLSMRGVSHAGMSRTYQQTRLFWEDTVWTNIETAVEWSRDRASSGSVREQTEQLLLRFDIAQYAGELPSALTHEVRRRVTVAQALASKPKVLLLDEPFAGLTFEEAVDLLSRLQIDREAGLSILVIDHNMRVVMELCDRIYVMHHGAVIVSGTPKEIQHNERVINIYLAGEL